MRVYFDTYFPFALIPEYPGRHRFREGVVFEGDDLCPVDSDERPPIGLPVAFNITAILITKRAGSRSYPQQGLQDAQDTLQTSTHYTHAF